MTGVSGSKLWQSGELLTGGSPEPVGGGRLDADGGEVAGAFGGEPVAAADLGLDVVAGVLFAAVAAVLHLGVGVQGLLAPLADPLARLLVVVGAAVLQVAEGVQGLLAGVFETAEERLAEPLDLAGLVVLA